MRYECVVACRHCNAPKPSITSDCVNPECISKIRVKWGNPNTKIKKVKNEIQKIK